MAVKCHLPLLFMTIACGCGYLYALLDVPTLGFYHVQSLTFPSSSFQVRRGFMSVLRWLESLNSREDLVVFGQLLTHEHVNVQGESTFATQVAAAVSVEMRVYLCKLGLQCGLVLFLFRRRVLSKNWAISTLCLCILSVICWKMAQTCLYEALLSPYRSSARSKDSGTQRKAAHDSRDQVTASVLNILFVARYGSICVIDLILARAYQKHCCESWPTTWKRVPGYLGSKNLVLGTFFFAAAGVSALSVLSPALRSLCEAAAHIEAVALVIAFGHYVFSHGSDHVKAAND